MLLQSLPWSRAPPTHYARACKIRVGGEPLTEGPCEGPSLLRGGGGGFTADCSWFCLAPWHGAYSILIAMVMGGLCVVLLFGEGPREVAGSGMQIPFPPLSDLMVGQWKFPE